MKTKLWDLFITFFKIGLFTFGGGYAMLSVIERETVQKHQWLTTNDMMSLVVIAESTPGPIAVNAATYVGFKQRGVLGAIVSTFALVLPSFVIISCLYFVIDALIGNRWFDAAFKGISCCVVVLVLNAFIKLAFNEKQDWFGWLAMIFATIVSLFTEFSVVLVILIGATIGLIIYLVRDKNSLPLSKKEDEQ